MYKQLNTEFKKQMIILNPGDYHVVTEDIILSTILGSCVSACLYDPENNVIGMNHFVLSTKLTNPSEYYMQKSGRFALNAMELLINEMMKRGAKKTNIKAKAFGGASVLPGSKDGYNEIPGSNIRFIHSFLEGENIELVAEDLGGRNGRKILFFNDNNFTVLQRKLSRLDETDAERKERQYWKEQKKIQDKEQESY